MTTITDAQAVAEVLTGYRNWRELYRPAHAAQMTVDSWATYVAVHADMHGELSDRWLARYRVATRIRHRIVTDERLYALPVRAGLPPVERAS